MKKTIVITGATSGIGNEVLKALARTDFNIFAGYRNPSHEEELRAISPNVVPFYIDMTKKETIEAGAKFISFQVDKIDTLINVAGCVITGAMENLSVDRIREQFEVNTFSHLDFSQKLFDKLGGGKIINISSMASFGIFPFIAPYCASKRALDILFNAMALEQNQVKIVSIKPGVIKTPLWDKSIELNQEVLQDCGNYQKEFEFLKTNAQKNNTQGLDVEKVVELILKVEKAKNPKSSYTIGFDAKVAEIFSKLPQDWINFVVKQGMKLRIK